jgi:hypothetical protein
MDKIAVIIIIVVVFAGVLFWVLQSGFSLKNIPASVKPTPMPEGVVLFYGDGCPHCKNVEDYLSANNIEQKVKITRLEVWHSQSNAKLLLNTAVACKLDLSQGVPVPFVWDGKNCITGDEDAIKFFKNTAGIK